MAGESFFNRLAHAFNVFANPNADRIQRFDYGGSLGGRPDRIRSYIANERSLLSSVYTRISVDTAAIEIVHSRHDENDRFIGTVDDGLQYILSVSANTDQAATAFRQDIVMTMLDKGVVAIVPTDTDVDPKQSSSYDIKSMRAAEVVTWYPQHVTVNLYNETLGRQEQITLPKSMVAIVQNPLYSVMNEPSSTYQRLVRKLQMLDKIDEMTSSNKLDLIIQLPYVIKTEARQKQASERRDMIRDQLRESELGIAYTDGTEKITQLNRPIENNMLGQITELKAQFYSELGLSKEVFDGTASEQVMLNYYSRTVQPILVAITEELKRTFITKTAMTQGQSIDYFRDPFALVPVSALAELADKFTRNEIVTSNEFRGVIGFKPVTNDPKADQLINSNMPQGTSGPNAGQQALPAGPTPDPSSPVDLGEVPPDSAAANPVADAQATNDSLDALQAEVDKILKGAS